MRTILLIFLFVFFFALPVFAQTVDTAWVRRYNGPVNGADWGRGIAVDGSGNVYVTGMSPGSGTGRNYATIKYDPAGNELWVRRYNGPAGYDEACAIALDGSGNVYVTGRSDGGGTSLDYATIKYDQAGNQLWAKRYNGPGNRNDWARAIAVDGSGNVYVTGQSDGGGTYYDCTTIKYDSAGNQLWVQVYSGMGNTWDEGWAIAVDGSGNVYVTGQNYATIKYDPAGNQLWVQVYSGMGNTWDEGWAIAVDGSGNVYVTGQNYATIKYDPAGNQLWVKTYNLPGNSGGEAYAIAVDGSGNVFVTGESWGGGTNYDYATIKYDSAGNQLWAQKYNGPGNGYDWAFAMAVDDSGDVYVTGWSTGSGTSYDYATVKYEPSGNQLWVKTYNGPGDGNDYAWAIAVDGSGNVYVTGFSTGSETPLDYATIKYDPAGNQLWVQRYNGPGNSDDYAYAIAVDGSGNVYVTGRSPGGGTSYDYATIKYWQNYPPIVVAPNFSQFLCAADTVRFTVTATDTDIVDTLTLSGPGITTPLKGVSPLYGDVKLYITSSGTYNYVYKVTDERGFTDYDTATLIVIVNSSPTVTAPDSSEFYCVPDTIRLRVTATDPDGADTLTLSGPGIPAPVKGLSPLDADVKFYIDTSGTFRYVYDVTDHCGFTDSDTAAWVVVVNRPPNTFSHLSPAQDSVMIYPSGLEHIVNFSWETSTDPNPGDQVKYDLLVSSSSTFHPDSTVVRHGLSSNECTDTIAIGRHYWKVRAYDNCTGTWSTQIWTFVSAIRGDANADKKVTVADVIYLVNFLFKSGPAPNPFQTGDVNCDGYVTVSDVVYLINYLFKGGPPPAC